MKYIATIILFLLITSVGVGQPSIQWKKAYGGTDLDVGYDVYQTNDGGYIIGGSSRSSNGNVTGNHGGQDVWLVKADSLGNIQWKKCLGGTGGEGLGSVEQTADGGYIIGALTQSNNGDVSGNHGSQDVWVVKTDSAGGIQWQKCLGGTSFESGGIVRQANDGGYIVAATTTSNDGDVTFNHGNVDCWVIKLTSAGSIEWQKSLGGTKEDGCLDVRQTIDSGYIIAGHSYSNDSDVTGHHGALGADFWIVKLYSNGNIQWQKSLGGTKQDMANQVRQTKDGGYVVAGHTFSNDGDVTGLHDYADFWIVKLDSTGNIEWQRCIGGSWLDMAYGIDVTFDGGYIVTGGSDSDDGNATNNYGNEDYWLVKLNDTGNIQWQKSLGGSDLDEPYTVLQTRDTGYIVIGESASIDYDVTGNHGNTDYWVVKLLDTVQSPHCNLTANITTTDSVLCATDSTQICAPSNFTIYHWNTGQTTSCITTNLAGNYYLTVTDASGCTAESNHLAITVHPLPPVAISVNGDTLSVHNAVTQQWYLNGSAITGATDSVYIAHTGGSYTVQVTDTNGCVATSLPVIVSGVENVTEQDGVSVFPNPTNNNWQLQVGNNFIGCTAEVYDASGRVVFQQLITNLPAGQAGHQSLITFEAARGVYLLRIASGKSMVVRKLVRL